MMNSLALYRKCLQFPFGSHIFSWGVGFIAPYFSTIRAHFDELKPNHVQVSIKNRRSVRNHFKTVHAIAMCNMAELAGGMMTDVSIPKGSRWIPCGMTVEYVKKAKTNLRAIADGTGIDWTQDGNVVVPVKVYDTKDEIVFTADITMNLKHKK